MASGDQGDAIPLNGASKGVVLKGLVDLFSDRRKGEEQNNENLIAELYRQIGQMKVDLDWLKKKSGLTP